MPVRSRPFHVDPVDVTLRPIVPGRWGDLRLRVLSAAVLAPLALGCIWIGGVAFTGSDCR